MEFLLGIDIGTSACKVAIFDLNGNVIAASNSEYEVYYGKQGYVEQDPKEWWEAVCIAIKEALNKSKIDPKDIIGIGVDGQSWSAVALDSEGEVLCNTPIWLDTRADDICVELNNKIGEEKIFELAGNSLRPSYSTAKIIWYERNLPETYKKIHKILQCNSYIVYELTNVYSQDVSQGYGIHCFDMKKMQWDYDMAKELGIPKKFLPKIYNCHDVVGVVTESAARITGLASGTPVVAGGLDAACGTLGAGVINSGETQEQGGQAGGMSICMDSYSADPRLILGAHVVENRWLLQGGTTGGGGVMRWLEREFGAFEREEGKKTNVSSFDIFNDIAREVSVGSDGVVFLPYMAGERSPIWDPNAKGVFYGLDFSKTKGHILRSAMEGVAFSLKHNLDIAKEKQIDVTVLKAVGGSANSELWTQIKSDITGKEIVVPNSDTATTLGAAILAGVGVSAYKSFEEAIEKTVVEKNKYFPNMTNNSVYKNNYNTYINLYKNLKELMDNC